MRLLALLAIAVPLLAQKSALPPAIATFEAWMNAQMEYRDLPGVAVGVIHDQQLVYARGFGFADTATRLPATPQTLFRMASNTKMFTAIAILQLRDAGKLRLDDPVSKHLPWFSMKPASDDDGPITVEHLITHSSGLPREAASPYWISFEFPSSAEIRKTVGTQTAAYPPDTRWKYSNLAVTLAGEIVEAVSGEKYEDYLHAHILKPLGMTATSLDKNVPGLAAGYGRRMPNGARDRMAFMDTKGIGPAAGLTSNVEDMAKFVSLQFRSGKAGGAQILSGATLREMHRVRMLENDWTSGNGLGFSVRRVRDKLYTGHGGSLAGYKTQTTFIVSDKVGAVVLSNGDDARPAEIAARLLDTIGEAAVKAHEKKTPKMWDPAWSRYAGLYRTMWGDTQVIAGEDELIAFDPTSDDPKAGPMKLVAKGGGLFLLDAKSGGSSIGEPVTFEERDGRVTGMKMGQITSRRVY